MKKKAVFVCTVDVLILNITNALENCDDGEAIAKIAEEVLGGSVKYIEDGSFEVRP